FLAPWLAFHWKPMEAIHYTEVLGMGLMMGLGNMLMTIGLKKVPSTVMSPVAYSQLFIGALLGFLIWQEIPNEATIAGSVLIITTGLAGARIAAQREKQLACC
ncbi:MAG: EamA family transporter, partial [Alphaproteobacteria bacterium]|nr:EamA family transporter [Alphaproteobacteria bacterium]